MDIAALATNWSQTNVQLQASTMMMKKALTSFDDEGQEMIDLMAQGSPDVGQNVDIQA